MSKRPLKTPKPLRHRALIATEAVLLVGLLKDYLTHQIMQPNWPPWGKVLFVMGSTVGVLGGLYLIFERLARAGVARTHDVVKAVPLPAPYIIIHVVVLCGLFELYSYALGFGWMTFW
jgi:hypothetical protein